MLIVDAHEDLAWNMLTFERDYTRSALETRRREAGSLTPARNDDTLLGWKEYQRGGVGIIFASLFASPVRALAGEWEILQYHDARGANRLYHAQIDLYERLADENSDKFRLIRWRKDLEQTLADWKERIAELSAEVEDASQRPETEQESQSEPPEDLREGESLVEPAIGLALLMEGADAILEAAEVEVWWERGVRMIGPAWRSTAYCGGTLEPGPLTPQGFELLERMADLGMGLDLSHMDEKAVLQALDFYPGVLFASHSNAASLLKNMSSNRHLSDRVIRGIIERNGVIGIVPFNGFLKSGWKRGDHRQEVHIEDILKQIDHICQMAGDAQHVGFGTDFDGGFGLQSVPPGIDSIADLRKLIPALKEKGYTTTDVSAVMGENWLRVLKQVLPESS